MNVLFLDTSALLAIATDTAGRDAILTAFDCADVVAASGLALTEALPALDRLTDERYARVDLEDAVRLTWDYLHIVPLDCLLYTSPSPRDLSTSRMPSSA